MNLLTVCAFLMIGLNTAVMIASMIENFKESFSINLVRANLIMAWIIILVMDA